MWYKDELTFIDKYKDMIEGDRFPGGIIREIEDDVKNVFSKFRLTIGILYVKYGANGFCISLTRDILDFSFRVNESTPLYNLYQIGSCDPNSIVEKDVIEMVRLDILNRAGKDFKEIIDEIFKDIKIIRK